MLRRRSTSAVHSAWVIHAPACVVGDAGADGAEGADDAAATRSRLRPANPNPSTAGRLIFLAGPPPRPDDAGRLILRCAAEVKAEGDAHEAIVAVGDCDVGDAR